MSSDDKEESDTEESDIEEEVERQAERQQEGGEADPIQLSDGDDS